MKRQTAFVLAFLAIAIAFSIPSRADDDGNFCTSKGYLAYELREGVTPGETGHVLKVVRFDPQSGIHAAGEMTLPDFQVHWMSCSADRVESGGYGTARAGDAPLIECAIEIASAQKVSTGACVQDPERWYDPPEKVPGPPNLGQWGRPGSIPLESLDTDHKYELRLTFSSKKVGGNSWRVHHKTELVQIGSQGHVSQRLLVYETRIVSGICGD